MAQEHERFDSERKGLLRNRRRMVNQQNGDIRTESSAHVILPKTTPCRPSQNESKTCPPRLHHEQPGLPACMHGQHMEQAVASASDLRQ